MRISPFSSLRFPINLDRLTPATDPNVDAFYFIGDLYGPTVFITIHI